MKDDKAYIIHMVERCERILRYLESGETSFKASELLQDAVIRNLEVIGEAAKRVSTQTREEISEIDWRRICGLRDVLIHNYIGVDLDEVWNIAALKIGPLKESLAQ